jgi:hypothetical protein
VKILTHALGKTSPRVARAQAALDALPAPAK